MPDQNPSLPRSNVPVVHRVVVIGAGAAGLTAAIFAARRGVRVLVLESRSAPGAKIRVSGGGRCNILPSEFDLERFSTDGSRNTLRNILRAWPLAEVRAFFENELRLPLYREATGKLFPVGDRSRDVVDALLRECRRVGVQIEAKFRVVDVSQTTRDDAATFELRSSNGSVVNAEHVIMTTGGKSLPRTGSDGTGYGFATKFGHSLVPTRPALVPLLGAEWSEFAGIALPVRLEARCAGKPLENRLTDFLFTHRGYSGPVVLDISRHFTRADGASNVSHAELCARWHDITASTWLDAIASAGGKGIGNVIAEQLPRRIAHHVAALSGVDPARPASQLRRTERDALVEHLTACPLPVTGDEGYEKAEVTAGGIPLSEIQPKTMQSRVTPGLYLAGEILDVVGHIGGYNFLWAWVTGKKAGEGAAAAFVADA